MHPDTTRRRFVFVSGNRAWGGSEELWSATAAVLAERGHDVTVFKSRVEESQPRIRRLRQLRCAVRDLARFPFTPRQAFSGLSVVSYHSTYVHEGARLAAGLAVSPRPDLVVISQGGNYDGVFLADICRRMSIPYALLSQKATDLYWPPDTRRQRMVTAYTAARASFFVARHNLELTQEQVGGPIANASIVRNPFLVPWEPRHDWPDAANGIRLACIGRLYPMEKGQDILLRVLARDRWRARPLSVTFYGSGLQRGGLESLARYLGLASVHFAGFTDDVAAIWDDHHGLILPSRCEGLPLALAEAMLSGRVPIVTDVGGNAEVVEDGVTGFVAAAAAEDTLDEAMDRAWSRRDSWREIGAAAADRIRTIMPSDPAAEFAQTLERMVATPPV